MTWVLCRHGLSLWPLLIWSEWLRRNDLTWVLGVCRNDDLSDCLEQKWWPEWLVCTEMMTWVIGVYWNDLTWVIALCRNDLTWVIGVYRNDDLNAWCEQKWWPESLVCAEMMTWELGECRNDDLRAWCVQKWWPEWLVCAEMMTWMLGVCRNDDLSAWCVQKWFDVSDWCVQKWWPECLVCTEMMTWMIGVSRNDDLNAWCVQKWWPEWLVCAEMMTWVLGVCRSDLTWVTALSRNNDLSAWCVQKIQESWYEKLHEWDRALLAYERKLEQNAEDSGLTLGKMRCLEAMGEWWVQLVLLSSTLVSAPCMLVTCLPAVGATGWSVLTWVSCFSFNSLYACLMSSNHVRSVDLHYTWVLYFSFNTLYACLMSSNHMRGMWICIPHGFHISGLTLCTLVLCLLTNWEICWSVFHMGLCHDAYLFACQSVYLSGELPCFLVWDKLWYYMIKKFLKPDSIIPTVVVSKIGFNDFVPISALVEIF